MSQHHPITASSLPLSSRALFVLTALVGVAGFVLTAWTIHRALFSVGPHMPPAAFAIFEPPATPGANPMKLYEAYRIFYLHVPLALATALISACMGCGAILYFISRHRRFDAWTVAAAEVGIVTCFLTMATGYVWGSFAWGTGWTWEPRLTTTLILWLSYVSLFVLRAAIEDDRKRRTFTAVYALLTVPLYPLVSKSIAMFGRESHPAQLADLLAHNEVSALLALAKPALMCLAVFFVLLRYQQRRVADDGQVIGALALQQRQTVV